MLATANGRSASSIHHMEILPIAPDTCAAPATPSSSANSTKPDTTQDGAFLVTPSSTSAREAAWHGIAIARSTVASSQNTGVPSATVSTPLRMISEPGASARHARMLAPLARPRSNASNAPAPTPTAIARFESYPSCRHASTAINVNPISNRLDWIPRNRLPARTYTSCGRCACM